MNTVSDPANEPKGFWRRIGNAALLLIDPPESGVAIDDDGFGLDSAQYPGVQFTASAIDAMVASMHAQQLREMTRNATS